MRALEKGKCIVWCLALPKCAAICRERASNNQIHAHFLLADTTNAGLSQ